MSEQRTDVVTQVIGGMEDLTKILWSAAALLAPWLVPLAPAAFFGWVMYQTATEAAMPKELAMVVGFVAALGLEAVNIAAAHAAVQLSHNREDHRWKFGLAIGLIIFYVIIGITSMLLLNADWNVKIVGAAMFLLAPVAITAQALTMDLVWTREDAEAEEAKEAEREALQTQMDYDYRIKLAERRWQHKTDVAIASLELAQSQHEPASSGHVCQQCGQSFGSIQAVNAHRRFCAGTNGSEPIKEKEIQTND